MALEKTVISSSEGNIEYRFVPGNSFLCSAANSYERNLMVFRIFKSRL